MNDRASKEIINRALESEKLAPLGNDAEKALLVPLRFIICVRDVLREMSDASEELQPIKSTLVEARLSYGFACKAFPNALLSHPERLFQTAEDESKDGDVPHAIDPININRNPMAEIDSKSQSEWL
eukprot:scaffold140_cov247-Pinguiococcus_pyrenoidosus.AAC.20